MFPFDKTFTFFFEKTSFGFEFFNGTVYCNEQMSVGQLVRVICFQAAQNAIHRNSPAREYPNGRSLRQKVERTHRGERPSYQDGPAQLRDSTHAIVSGFGYFLEGS